jgi:CzcA family heavy metal efflux pump
LILKIASWADRHARSLLFLVLVLVVAGVICSQRLPVSLFPRVDFPRIRLNVSAGEQPAEQMSVQVTRPMEEALRAIPGVRGVESRTSRGAAEVWLTFDWGDDMNAALLQAESQINRIVPQLPPGTTFVVRRMDPSVFSTISYSITSKTKSLADLRDWAQYELAPVLSTVPGVSKVDVQGGAIEEYRVEVDPAKLQAQGLAVSDVAAALSAANVQTPAGAIEDRYRLYLVVTDTRFKSMAELGLTVLRSGPSGVIRLGDVASIRKDIAPPVTRATADGHDAILFDVYQQPGANTVAIAEGIHQALAREQKRLPPGADITITKWYDQSDLILSSAKSVRDAVLIGVGLAALVLLLFLRNWRITLVAAITVPTVLAITTLLLYLLNSSFNIMTLGGMAAAVGLIIDDAIVICEHIVRRLQMRSALSASDRVRSAADEFSKPLAGSSLSTIIIHIPPAFLIGYAGAFFGALSLSMASSLVISFLIAWLAIPILAARFLRGKNNLGSHSDADHAVSHRIYAGILRPFMRVPVFVVLFVVPLLAFGYWAYQRLPSGFMPAIDEGGFIIDYVAPPGTSLTETDRVLRQVEAIIQRTPEVKTFSRRTGFAMGGDFSESNTGDFFVLLKPLPRRDIEEVMDDIRTEIEHQIPGVEFELSQLMEDIVGDITGRPEPVVISLFSDDERVLESLAPAVKEAVEKIDGLVEVKSGLVPAGDAISIEVDRVKASLEGVDPESITRTLEGALSGDIATQIQSGPKLVNVRVWIPEHFRKTDQDISDLPIRAPDGHVFPLKRIATLEVITGQPEITRQDLKQVVSVTGRIEGRDLGSTMRDVRAALDAPGLLPTGVRYTLGGLYEQQQIAFQGLLMVIAAAVTLVFLLLLFLYESFRVAIAILLTTLLAIAFVFIGLWVTGTELNISSLMGMVMIVGNVTEVAIFYYSEFADFPHPGTYRERLIAAGRYRMRAIVMTTAAAILALLPLALNIEHGSTMLQPLAIAIIAGLVAQLPLVLGVLPLLLALIGPRRNVAPVARSSSDHVDVA